VQGEARMGAADIGEQGRGCGGVQGVFPDLQATSPTTQEARR
jgi:hypothetical protein